MSKVITSPVKRFPGTVTLPEFLTFPQAIAWEKANQEASKVRANPESTDAEFVGAWLPGVLACVEACNLEGFDLANPPATPRAPVTALLAWMVGEIAKLYDDEEEIPND